MNLSASMKKWVNLFLALGGAEIMAFYSIWSGICSYLRGELAGIDLEYAGIMYMTVLISVNFLIPKRSGFRKGDMLLALRSSGLGGEIILVGFRIWAGKFCPFCLGFAAIAGALFAVNFRRERMAMTALFIWVGLTVFMFFFSGSVTSAYAEEALTVPSFGKSFTRVRIYTDYFCSPCQKLEPKLEPMIRDLVKKRTIEVTFVETPVYRESMLYIRYFLYALNGRNQFDQAMTTRHALFEAAGKKITEPAVLEKFLKEKQVNFKKYEGQDGLAMLFKTFGGYLAEDNIDTTPSMAIYNGLNRSVYKGDKEIIAALKKIK